MSVCSHGVPRIYYCADSNHETHKHHKCDDNGGLLRLNDLDSNEATLIRALIAANKAAKDAKDARVPDALPTA